MDRLKAELSAATGNLDLLQSRATGRLDRTLLDVTVITQRNTPPSFCYSNTGTTVRRFQINSFTKACC